MAQVRGSHGPGTGSVAQVPPPGSPPRCPRSPPSPPAPVSRPPERPRIRPQRLGNRRRPGLQRRQSGRRHLGSGARTPAPAEAPGEPLPTEMPGCSGLRLRAARGTSPWSHFQVLGVGCVHHRLGKDVAGLQSLFVERMKVIPGSLFLSGIVSTFGKAAWRGSGKRQLYTFCKLNPFKLVGLSCRKPQNWSAVQASPDRSMQRLRPTCPGAPHTPRPHCLRSFCSP